MDIHKHRHAACILARGSLLMP